MRKRLTALILTLIMILPAALAVSADDSTTTYKTAAKDFSPNTEIYIETEKNYGDYPYYGAMYEPTSGAYYGRVLLAGNTDHGYGVVNKDALDNETAVAFYTSLDDPYSVEYWSYLYGAVTADGNHILLLDLNFNSEGDSCPKVINGDYDEKLIADFTYLSTLTYPVFIRIGGEVNVWTKAAQPATFINAYKHIARLSRQYSPNVALVFSPNYSSTYMVDMDTFYPGDKYVDWIGVSLYYNQYAHNGQTGYEDFMGVGEYGDPLLNVQQAVNLSRMHQKPLMQTEGGSIWTLKLNGTQTDCSSFAADKARKAMAYLNAVNQEIKCIIYSDTNFGSTSRKYSITENATVANGYNLGVASNPTLRSPGLEKTPYYTKIGSMTDPVYGEQRFIAYSYSKSSLTASWYVDGNLVLTRGSYPYTLTLNTADYSQGQHKIKVVFSDGNSKSGNFWVEKPVFVPGYEAECDKDGRVGAWKFNGSFYSDEECKVLLTDDELIIKAPGHDWKLVSETPPTETEPGKKEYECDVCHDVKTEPVRATSDKFTDTEPFSYYYTPVLWAVSKGITDGTSEKTFSPGANCTRGQAVTFLWRAYGSPEPGDTENPFDDVTDTDYFYKPVIWAIENGITDGTSDTTFSPNAECTRAQIVTFMWRAAGTPETEASSTPFTDVKDDDYFFTPVLWAVESGITDGTSDTTFSPGSKCTRAQIVTFLWRAVGKDEAET